MNRVRAWLSWSKKFVLGHKLLLGGAVVVCVVLATGPTIYANLSTASRRYQMQDVPSIPSKSVVVVFGAGVLPDGTPTDYLKWRVAAAADLIKAGKAKKIIMSGDNSTKHYNEPVAMAKYAESLGVDKRDIVLDYAGLSTYDTCYRAKAIFGVHDAILVTQGYHLPRAVMTCRSLGVDAVGVAAVPKGRDYTVSYIMREYISTAKATVQLIIKPSPTFLGKPEPYDKPSAN